MAEEQWVTLHNLRQRGLPKSKSSSSTEQSFISSFTGLNRKDLQTVQAVAETSATVFNQLRLRFGSRRVESLGDIMALLETLSG